MRDAKSLQRLAINGIETGRNFPAGFSPFTVCHPSSSLTRQSTGMVLLLAILSAILLSGCNREPDVQPFSFNDPPWTVGEVALYTISEKDDENVGTVRYDMLAGGRYVAPEDWTIRRETVTPGDTEIVAVEATNSGLRPRSSTLIRVHEEGNEMVFSEYNQGQVDMRLTTVDNNTTPRQVNILSDARDQRTLLQLARMLPLDEGYATRFNSYLPVADQRNRVTLQVMGRETIEAPAGSYDTWHIELDGDSRQTEAWIGVDPPFPLVKYREGGSGATYDLLEYTPGQQE